MTTTGRRLRARHANDEGSAVAFVPILGLLVIAGMAALAGIALQPEESEAAPATVVTAAQLGQPCTEQVGPMQSGTARAAWAQEVADCVEQRVVGAYRARAEALAAGFDGVVWTANFDATPVVVVRWNGEAPAVVNGWAARSPGGLVTVSTVSTPGAE